MTNSSLCFENSATVFINSLCQQKQLSGVKIYNLSVGEPKLAVHQILISSAIEAMQQAKTFYPPVAGYPELRSIATEWINSRYGCNFTSKNCLVVNGGKFGIYLLLQNLLRKGDEVLILSPYWVSYPAITKLFGGIPIIVETNENENWKVNPAVLAQACTAKAKVLILNNGNNPTSTLYSKTELKNILMIAKKHNLTVLSDEVYSGLTYDSQEYVSCGSFLEYQNNVIVIQSCSKNFSMTGWRIGFVFANETMIKQLSALVSQSTSGVTTISQSVAVAAFKHADEINGWVRNAMQKRRDITLALLNRHFDVQFKPPLSSLYFFIALKDLGVEIKSRHFCSMALEEANVALVPGDAFGKDHYIRLSFGTVEQDLEQGITALVKHLNTHGRV